jgi:thioredoxin 1
MDTITTQSFFEKIRSENLVLIDFSASWCGPCKRLTPVLDALSKELPAVKFYKVDIDESELLRDKYGIRSVPTILVFENGQCKERLMGLHSKEEIKAVLDKYLEIKTA